jgi:hypothetical protein
VHDALDVLQHHDRVVHHDADGQHHAEQRERVDRVAQHEQARERADQGNRHRDGRDQRGAPVLQEDEHHQEHQHHGLAQRDQHLADRHFHEARRVVGNRVGEAVGKARRQRLHRLLHLARHVQRVRAGLQEDAQQSCGLAVDAAHEVVVLAAQLHPRHVAQAHRRAVGVGADDDVLELARFREAALGGDGVDQLLPLLRGRLADLAGGELRVLLVDGARHVRGGELQLRKAVGLEPHTHRVVLGTENLHVGRARHALQLVEHVERDIVAGVQIVVAAVRRVERQHLQERGRALFHRHALAPHFLRQLGLGLLHAVVDVERGLVDVGADLEGHLDLHHAIAGRGGAHVEHVLHAVDGVLDGRGHGLFQHLGAGARVHGLDRDHGRCDLRVLGDGQAAHRGQAGDHDEDGQHGREDRPIDEEA